MSLRTARSIIIANFILFVTLTFALGGDAINGKREAGRYFLGSHGHYTEVSYATYVYSYAHTLLTFVIIAVFVGVNLLFRGAKNSGS
ncbi:MULTISPECIES: hypothetical protein [Sphingomonas]|uniref:hypothetical protein n=1 Tax=Sphingomonas TaxID=13687 RepID=UPI000DEF35AD|nr:MULTISPECIES: hypothetical protein [Sphingomonas]